MSTATSPTIPHARLSPDGKKIILSHGEPKWLEFCRSLPHARWDQVRCQFTCDCTPIAAYRITALARGCDRLGDVAHRFHRSLFRSRKGLTDQPAIRKTTAWPHQARAYQFALPLEAAMLAMDMGTGKSKTTIDLLVNWDCQTILVLCPVAVMGVWRREFGIHAGKPISVCVLDKGTTDAKVHIALGAMKFAQVTKQPLAIVVNYETARLPAMSKLLLSQQWDAVICDESHRIKAHNSSTSKFAYELSKVAKRRLCLSGTPLAQSPLDAFGQYRFLDPGLFGLSWSWFSHRYALHGNPQVPQQITGYANQDELHDRLAMITYRCKASEVLDLPEAIHQEIPCEIAPKARKVYEQLCEDLAADLETGVVTAANALVRLLRLQQVTSGFCIEDDTKKVHLIDASKAAALEELLGDVGREPVVVFCRFRHDLDAVRRLGEKLGRNYGELSGERRDGLSPLAKLADGVDLLGCQIQSGGVGIDLTAARYAVYYSLGFSLAEYEQSLARLHRPGQKRTVNYYHLIAERTVDNRVYEALRARKGVIEYVLEGLGNS
ncbi:MAG: DEAD/DEAH box helicase [Planctomycetota bacterium]